MPPAEIASLSRKASESSSTERSARVANIETTRERIGASSSPAGSEIFVSVPASGAGVAPAPFGDSGTRIVTSVPRPGAPLSSKLLVSAAISGSPRRRLRCSMSASGRIPEPKSRTVTARQPSSGQASTSSSPVSSMA